MVDRPPPQRYRVVERGGRLEVIDTLTGATPPSAAERMAAHDSEFGQKWPSMHRSDNFEDFDIVPSARPAVVAPQLQTNDKIRAALNLRKQPWAMADRDHPQLAGQTMSEKRDRPSNEPKASASRPSPQSANNKTTMVTGKWWDKAGPRTITLGPIGRKRLTTGFVTALAVGFVASIILLIIQPVLLMGVVFVMFRFGVNIIAPLGARLIDEAIRADGGGA